MNQASGQQCGQGGYSAFAMAACLLGIMALAQLVVAGVALALRFKEASEVKIVEREVIREVRVEVPVPAHSGLSRASHATRAPRGTQGFEAQPASQPSPLSEPEVADAEAARLLKEAREARVGGDMGKAIVKLEQALHHAPGEPSLLYELAVVHEQMGIFDQAALYYEEVFRMGMSRAGALYEQAAAKLRDGFTQPADMLGKLSLGRVQIFNDPGKRQGEQVILTIPVQKAPNSEVEMDAIEVEVRFFNRTSRGEIKELADSSWVASSWISLPWDWAGGVERLRMTYSIPERDPATEHLFGEISYYGQVVTLSYGNEVLDVQAWPRDLAARVARQPSNGFGQSPAPEFQDSLLPGFDPNIPLLPALPE